MRDYPPMPDPSLNTAARPILAPNEGLFMGLAASGSSSSSSSSPSMHRPSIHPPLLPIKESPLAPKLEPRLDLSMPNLPQKTRKRHKVATSCNRCRQNKRKCDSGIPCSNCRRNKADCLYTDAQLSRSTWGDSPLSREKIIGVSTADILEMDSQLVTSTETTVLGSSLQAASRGTLKSPDKPSSIKKGSTCRKGSTTTISNAFASPAHLAPFSSSSTAIFNPGHASIDHASTFDRRKELLATQTREIAKVIRIAKPGPQLDLSNIIAPRNPGPALNVQPTIKDHHNYPFTGLESPHPGATQSTAPDHGRFLASVSTQSPSKMTLQQVTDTRQPSLPQQTQHALQIQQARQGNLGGHITSTTRLPLSYQDGGTNEEFMRLSSLVRSRGDQSTTAHEHQNGVTMVSPSGEGRMPLHQSSNLQPSSSGLSNPLVQRHSSLSQSALLQEQPSHQQYLIHQHHQQERPNSPSSNLGTPSPLQQQHPYPLPGKSLDPNHTISSAAPTSSIGVASRLPSHGAWGTPSYPIRTQDSQVEWKGPSISHQSTGHSNQNITSQSVSYSHQQHLLHAHAPTVTVAAVVPTPATTPSSAVDERTDTMRMRKIAKDMLDCKAYDYSIMLPRHISQEYDEIWVAPQSVATANSLQGIPRQLLMLPKDANFLADVFFEHAHFYYPIINRAAVELHLMEPHTPQALFLLNIVFMGACKHLGRSTDIKRAIQFRERAREIQHYVDGKVRITRMQTTLLGSQVIYGVFVPVIGLSVICGTYRALPTIDTVDENEPMVDLAAESHSIAANKGLIPEAAYQQRLWTFWGLYTRDAMGRLYFGWPHGIDTMVIDSELPKIKGCVGLGGTRRSLNGNSGLDTAATGKRRGPVISKKQTQRERKLLKAEAAAKQSGRDVYRMALSPGSDDDDDDEDDEEAEDQDDASDLEQDDITVTDESQNENGLPKNRRFKLNSSLSAETSSSTSQPHTKDKALSFSGLSTELLERQSRGEDITRRQGTSGSGSSYSAQVRRHMDRMRVLLDAEEDITDGGSYARILFLEEIKLWSIGRRVGLYLQGRSTTLSGSPAAAVTGSFSPYDRHATDAARCSESAWRDDKELQGLQAELIAWDQALPPMFKFRQDLEQPDINHKVNGRLSVLRMYYYTITIMLQSSYLPIPQYLLSSSRSTATKSPESLSQEYDGLFSRAASMTGSEDGGPRIKSEAEEYFHTGRSPQPSSNTNGYFNTPHRMCTQLSNVLFHHIELMMDSYPNWCSIQIKVNQSLTAALRVSCLNARLSSNSKSIRDEAKAGFKMGSELFKRLALLPEPLTVRDWPAEEDVQVMLDLEEEFRELMTTQDEEDALAEARSRSQTRDDIDSFGLGQHGDPGDHLLYTPELQDGGHDGLSFDSTVQPQYDIFGFNTEGFQFSYGLN